MEEKKTDSIGGAKFIPPVRPPTFVPRAVTAAKPVIVSPEAAPRVAPQERSGDIIIHTMQDDVAEIGKVVKKAPQNSLNSNQPAATASAGKTFPLPPKDSEKQQKIVLTPHNRQRPRWLMLSGAGLAIVLVIGALGAGAWYWFTQDSPPTPDQLSVEAGTIIPATADVVIAYTLPDAAAQTAVISLWSKNGPASLSGLLQGDPRLLLNDTETNQFFYVALNGDSRPYLLVPQNTATTTLLTNTYDVAVTKYEGWYIAHQIDPNPYIEALKKGTLAGSTEATLLKEMQPDSPLSMLVRSSTLANLRSAFGGKQTSKGPLQAMALRLKASPDGKAILFEGTGQTSVAVHSKNATSELTSPKLLEALPGDVTAVRTGPNFANDVKTWQESGGPLTSDILAQPTVNQLLQSLPFSYAWYRRTGPDNTPDTGLIIDISSLPSPLQMPATAIEQALPALLPLVLEQQFTTPVAFKDGVYGQIPLRFVNILGPTLALDYAVYNNYLLIASSKEGMYTLIDTIAKRLPSPVTSPTWQNLFTEWGAIPASRDIVFGSFNEALLQKLLPLGSAEKLLQLASTTQIVNDAPQIKGFLLK